MKSHYVIPFFIPHEGCPFTCIFCAQRKISGRIKAVPAPAIPRTISKYLDTIPKKHVHREVAFFGGSFTGLPQDKQEAYLKAVRPFIKNKTIDGIRLSTRPDYIDERILALLKKYGVTCIELGVQSLSEDVLKAAKRGHTVPDVRKASRLILKKGFTLGHQLMSGLPGSTLSKELMTARISVSLGAREVRIYPVIVIKGTHLAEMWRKKRYRPLTEDEALKRCARLVEFFNKKNVRVLRCGLHPSEGLLTGADIVAGPFHQSFGQKVESYLYAGMIKKFLSKEKHPGSICRILYNPSDGASAIGYKRANALGAESIIKKRDIFAPSDAVAGKTLIAEYENGMKRLIGALK